MTNSIHCICSTHGELKPRISILSQLLQNVELAEAFATNCLAVAAQILLHPAMGKPIREVREVDSLGLQKFRGAKAAKVDLLSAMVAWSASYVHGSRLLASLALFHVLEENLLETPGWYLEALHRQVPTVMATLQNWGGPNSHGEKRNRI